MSLADKLEHAIRKAIDEVAKQDDSSEAEWYEQLDEALSVIREGVVMRLKELAEQKDDDEP